MLFLSTMASMLLMCSNCAMRLRFHTFLASQCQQYRKMLKRTPVLSRSCSDPTFVLDLGTAGKFTLHQISALHALRLERVVCGLSAGHGACFTLDSCAWHKQLMRSTLESQGELVLVSCQCCTTQLVCAAGTSQVLCGPVRYVRNYCHSFLDVRGILPTLTCLARGPGEFACLLPVLQSLAMLSATTHGDEWSPTWQRLRIRAGACLYLRRCYGLFCDWPETFLTKKAVIPQNKLCLKGFLPDGKGCAILMIGVLS
jgi:hypothetical protein